MDKNEILEKSRKENKNKNVYELEVVSKASSIAYRVGGILCCLTAVLDVIFTNTINFTSWMIFFSMLSTVFIVKYIKMKKKHELIMAVLYIACFILFAVKYTLSLRG